MNSLFHRANFDGFLTRIFGTEQTVGGGVVWGGDIKFYSSTGTTSYSVTVLPDEKTNITVLLTFYYPISKNAQALFQVLFNIIYSSKLSIYRAGCTLYCTILGSVA